VISDKLEHIKCALLVLSGKGGVGKSTMTCQLAYTLSNLFDSLHFGVMDVDICGPSVPKILGVEGEFVHETNAGWEPVWARDNLGVLSVGLLGVDAEEAVIWRGPKKNGLIKHFLKDTYWDSPLDLLVIDTPPGTSDEHLTLAQLLKPLKDKNRLWAMVVTTPQELALLDVRKEIDFLRKVAVPIVGIVENMSGFVCPKCNVTSDIFPASTGGAKGLSEQFNVPFLGSIPLDPRLGYCCDKGQSFVEEYPNCPAAAAFTNVAHELRNRLELKENEFMHANNV